MMPTRRCLLTISAFALLLGYQCASASTPDQQRKYVQPSEADADTLCNRYEDAEPPLSDRPTPSQRLALAGCDGEALLYGIGRSADPVQARLCAFVQRDAQKAKNVISQLFDGNGLLMTIYANGMGVAPNKAVAIHLACDSVWTAEAERTLRVPHLAGIILEPWYNAVFSPCDDITSGVGEAFCAYHASRINGVENSSKTDIYASHLPVKTRQSFALLRVAQANWAKARANDEMDGGSDLNEVEIEEHATQDNDFVAMLSRLQKSRPPQLGSVQLRKAQASIDATLPVLLQGTFQNVGQITPDKVRDAQAAWIAYRDAWGAFAKVAYPAWGSDGAEAWVTMKRADMLSHLLSHMN